MVESRLNKANSLTSPNSRESKERRKRLEAVDKTLGIWMGLPEEEHEDEVESHLLRNRLQSNRGIAAQLTDYQIPWHLG